MKRLESSMKRYKYGIDSIVFKLVSTHQPINSSSQSQFNLSTSLHLFLSSTSFHPFHQSYKTNPPHKPLTMRVKEIILGLSAILSAAQAAALPADAAVVENEAAVTNVDFESLQARIAGSEANALLCITPSSSKCGLYITYTNGQRRETVQWESGGLTSCAFSMTRKHTNGNGFWGNLDVFGTPGMHIGFNPTGKQIALGKSPSVIQDQNFLNARCQSVFKFGNVDAAKSTQSYWPDLGINLY